METMNALSVLVKEGKIKHVGLSEATSAQIRAAHAVHPVTAVEMEYSLWSRGIEADILPTCRELGIAVLAYSPLGRGFLAGSFKSAADAPKPESHDFRAMQPRFEAANIPENAKACRPHLTQLRQTRESCKVPHFLSTLASNPAPAESELCTASGGVGGESQGARLHRCAAGTGMGARTGRGHFPYPWDNEGGQPCRQPCGSINTSAAA